MPLALRFGSLDISRNSYPADVQTAAKVVERPWIEAVQEGRPRPFWSVMVPIYNCPPHYLSETLESVACHRLHAGADTNRVTRAGENAADERRSIDLSCADFFRPGRQDRGEGHNFTLGGL
jgi:hypothetical protein